MSADHWLLAHSDAQSPCDVCGEVKSSYHLMFARADHPDIWTCLKCTSAQIPAHGARRCRGCGDPLPRGRRERCLECHRHRMEHVP